MDDSSVTPLNSPVLSLLPESYHSLIWPKFLRVYFLFPLSVHGQIIFWGLTHHSHLWILRLPDTSRLSPIDSASEVHLIPPSFPFPTPATRFSSSLQFVWAGAINTKFHSLQPSQPRSITLSSCQTELSRALLHFVPHPKSLNGFPSVELRPHSSA